MRHARRQVLVLAFGLMTAAAQEPPAAPEEQYKALLKEYQRGPGGSVSSDEERMTLVGRVFKHRSQLALKFLELAEKHPNDPVAVDALIQAVWQVNTTPWPVELVGSDDASTRAFALLQRDHLRSGKLGPVCQRVSHGFRREYETFLRAVLEKGSDKDVQAQACLSLAHFLLNRLQRVDLLNDRPELAREFEDLFGREYLEELRRRDRAEAIREAEALFERAKAEHGDVKLPDGGTIGGKAASGLFEIRHLVVGKEAPEIEGEDQDGVRFKLRDYRGKVVLLDFWSQA